MCIYILKQKPETVLIRLYFVYHLTSIKNTHTRDEGPPSSLAVFSKQQREPCRVSCTLTSFEKGVINNTKRH
jgi:hypothetical protein